MCKVLTVWTVVVAVAGTVLAETRNRIYQYNPALSEPDNYIIDDNAQTIYIVAGYGNPGLRFKFEARTEELQGGNWVDIGPGDIWSIETYAGNPGMVWLEINGDPYKNHVYGARDLRAIYLATSYTTSSDIWRIRISGDLGEVWLSDFDSIGLIEVGGDLLDTLHSQGDITNAVTIGGNLYGYIVGDSAHDITVNGSGPHTGSISVQQLYDGTISINGPMSGDLAFWSTMSGSVTVDGNFSGSINMSSASRPTGVLTGSIVIDGDVLDSGDNHIFIHHLDGGHFECDDLDLHNDFIGWMLLGPHTNLTLLQTGTIRINGTLRGVLYSRSRCNTNITINSIDAYTDTHPIGLGGVYTWGGFMEDFHLTVTNDFTHGNIWARVSDDVGVSLAIKGAIDIGGNLGAPGKQARIQAQYPEQPEADIDAVIHIGGDLYPASTGAAILASGDLNGQILIDGSMFNGAGNEIQITGTMSSEGAVAVDYDGFEPEDSWDEDARVSVDGTPYPPNTAARVYEITCLRGDMDNDDDVDAFDIDPFVLALSNPAAYAAAYPGLAGSLHYHADANCDDVVDSFDVDPFVLRMTDPDEYQLQYGECEAGCPGGGERGSPGPTEPADVAALLRECVAPERLPMLIWAVEDVIAAYANSPRGQFWAEVLAALR